MAVYSFAENGRLLRQVSSDNRPVESHEVVPTRFGPSLRKLCPYVALMQTL